MMGEVTYKHIFPLGFIYGQHWAQNLEKKVIMLNVYTRQMKISSMYVPFLKVLTYVVGLRDWKRHVERVCQMILRVQRRRAPVSWGRVHRLLLAGRGWRVAGGVGRLDGQTGHGRPGGQRIDCAAATAAGGSGTGGGGGRLVRVELQAERGGQRRRGHVAAVVLWTADGRRANPATPGIRRLVHRPCGVLTHWRRDGCGQPVPGMINARPSAGRRVAVMQPAATSFGPPRLPTMTILCNGGGGDGGR